MGASILPEGELTLHQDGENEQEQLAKILLEIRKGSAAAESALVSRLRAPLVLQFRGMGWGVESEDLAHDTLIVLLDKLRTAKLDEPTKINAYCKGIASNLSLAGRRKLARRRTQLDSDLIETQVSDTPSLELHLQRNRLQEQIIELINRLPRERDQLILKRVFLEEEDKEQVQAQINVSSSQFDRVLYRSKKRLSKLVAHHYPDLMTASSG